MLVFACVSVCPWVVLSWTLHVCCSCVYSSCVCSLHVRSMRVCSLQFFVLCLQVCFLVFASSVFVCSFGGSREVLGAE